MPTRHQKEDNSIEQTIKYLSVFAITFAVASIFVPWQAALFAAIVALPVAEVM